MPDAKALKILVVDDQQTMRGIARQCLKRIGVTQVTIVASGEAAMDALKSKPFDAIISDLNMPGMSGLQLAEAKAAHPVLRSVPIFVATSEVYLDSLDRTNIDGVVAKPFSVADMKTALESAVGAIS